ncbi:L-ascorbate metabolism protein UlaG (beta-lactamase superfamily) [Halarchaeum solikamskense]|uniref:MBL fold metallo-hydrolase n=1 Tax=Halarchaeum nitratireducens TaxID=489913 RepID=UPI001B3A97FE|nr:MBL fold metallo-hydrolase [Halarchaeum solikamskense]MBP2251200.1 L-ascorbate metabolism protein UlaG (beta-lactamase superfamily) [Halarchaeum solikamskense]
MDVTLARHATLVVDLDGTRFLVDPMLSEAGENPPVENTPRQRRNPLVDLPDVDLGHDAVLVTHRHQDHWDAWTTAVDPDTPLFCNPAETEAFRADGLTDVRPVEDAQEFAGVSIERTPARHGHGEVARAMAPVCGFVLDGSESLYLTGDTVWYDPVAEVLEARDLDAVVVNAGAAQFVDSEPITMDAAGVRRVVERADCPVVAVHMGAINHCLLERDDLREAVPEAVIPDDGETVSI